MWVKSEVTQSCPTLCDPMDCSLPGFSVHGIFQARILEWVAISFSRGSSPLRDQTQVSHISGTCFYPLSYQGSWWYWELDYKESSTPKNWCFWTVLLEKTLESPLDRKEIQLVNPKGNQSWIFIGRTDAEAPILWPPNVKNWLIGKDPDAGKGRRRGWQRMRWLDGITDAMVMSLSKLQGWWWTGKPGMLQFMGLQRGRHDWATELNWLRLGLFHLPFHLGTCYFQKSFPLSPKDTEMGNVLGLDSWHSRLIHVQATGVSSYGDHSHGLSSRTVSSVVYSRHSDK